MKVGKYYEYYEKKFKEVKMLQKYKYLKKMLFYYINGAVWMP